MRVVGTIAALVSAVALAACQSSGPLEFPDEMLSAAEPEELPPPVAQREPERRVPYADLSSNVTDKEEADLRREFRRGDMSVLREGDNLVLQLDGDMLFESDAPELTPRGRDLVQSLASMFNRYPATYVNIDGFTAGARMLSQERADAFAIELERAGVQASRLSALGHDDSPAAKLEITLEPAAG